jgi:SWI/SNF-related matrix-associated actin-dependent regulator 1 of chromatin subfamily A
VIAGWLDDGAAVLRFPYDERLKRALRAIPGRRWDPLQRVWRVPLSPESAASIDRWIGEAGPHVELTDELERSLEVQRGERDGEECLIELVRFDLRHWLSVCDDAPSDILDQLRAHPGTVGVEAVGRLVVPLDQPAAELASELCARDTRVWLSPAAERALAELFASPTPLATRAEAVAAAAVPQPMRVTVARDGDLALFVLEAHNQPLADELAEYASAGERGWTLPLTLESWRMIEEHSHGFATRACIRCVAALRRGEEPPTAVLERSMVHGEGMLVLAPGCDPSLLERFAALNVSLPWRPPRHGVHEHALLPVVRADPFCVPELDAFIAAHDVVIAPEALDLLAQMRDEHALAAGIVALSAADDAELDGSDALRLGGELMPFQRAGVRYLVTRRRAFLADEQGLGKTIEAIAAIEHDGAYPAIVVCPASLKLNWLRELERWVGHRSVTLVSGRGAAGASIAAADITLVNYDIVAARVDALRAIAPRALVLDESHYLKNARAKRTKAVIRLAAGVPLDGLVFALSGTPVMSRAEELISQLRIIGRLGDFGSGKKFGERFRGPDAHLRLHWHLRARCFVRRLKLDVLPQLPEKTRAIVPVELDNEAEYRLAEEDLIGWLRSQPLDLRELDARVASALRAERLVRLSALKLIAARGKLHAALAWIHDFLASGERLVVFASHREIQQAVLERFPRALHLLGADTHADRDRTVGAFQAEDTPWNQLLICSLAVAGQGITLTRASNVAFLELDWTPATHDQAEDRCHRIGQSAAVNAAYLLAADTIDETIAKLLERKRAVVAAVTDGAQEDEEAILDALARELRSAPYRHLRAVA